MADNDYKTDNDEFEKWKENKKIELTKNGMDDNEADQLLEDMSTDPFASDPDMDTYLDTTIQDRLNKFED